MHLVFPEELQATLTITNHEPPHTSNLMLPYADAETITGDFGTVIKQLIDGSEYNVHFHAIQANTPLNLEFSIKTGTIILTYILQGAPAIADTRIPEGIYYSLFYFPPGRYPLQLEAGRHIIVHIHLDPSMLQLLAGKYFEVFEVYDAFNQKAPELVRHNGHINAPVWELVSHLLNCSLEDEERAMYQHARILDLLIRYAEELAEDGNKRSGGGFSFSQEDIQAVLRAGEWKLERLDEPLQLKEIARKLNLHPKKMSAGFKMMFGENFSKAALEKRIEKAKHLLRGTEMSLENIAFETGYCNTSAFIRAFRRETGITPANYRK